MSEASVIAGLSPSAVIAVLMGGPGSERMVSLASGRAVAGALVSRGFRVREVELVSEEFSLPAGTGLVFNLIHGTFGEDGRLQDVLEARGVPYTGAGPESSRLAFDKCLAKRSFVAAGVPTPRDEVVDVSGGLVQPSLRPPYVVKPPREGSSVGVHIVREAAAASEAMRDAARYGDTLLVEEFIAGLELTVGVLGDEALPVIQIIPPEGVYDMASKYPWLSGAQGSRYLCPAPLDPETTRAVQDAALAAHRALGVEVYSRVDVLLDEAGRPFVLEVNTIPGMTETSLLPKAAAAAGIGFADLCLRIAEQSLAVRSL